MTDERIERMQENMRQTEERWRRVRRALKREDQIHADRLAAMIHAHAEDRFPSISDPLEAAMLAVFIEMHKQLENRRFAAPGSGMREDPGCAGDAGKRRG